MKSRYRLTEINTMSDLKMPDKKQFYVNGKLDRERHFEAICEMQKKLFELADDHRSAAERLDCFTKKVSPLVMGADAGKNRLYSPVTLFVLLGALAYLSDGDTRKQVLDLLGYGSLEEMQKEIETILKPLSVNLGSYASLLSASAWFSDSVQVNREKLEEAADCFHMESFRGNPEDNKYVKTLQKWVNNSTGNLLKDAVKEIGLREESVMTLITSMYFKSFWDEKFDRKETKPGIFHGSEGEMNTSYMYRSEGGHVYFAEKYTAMYSSFGYGDSMLFILPNEGYTPEEIINDDHFLDLKETEHGYYIVNEVIPRFDIQGKCDVKEVLKRTGVTDLFDPRKCDFTGAVTATDNIYVSDIDHRCRLMVDEDGCKGAGYAIVYAVAAGLPPEEYCEFVLDRPFIVVVKSRNSLPLFIGVVNEPEKLQ